VFLLWEQACYVLFVFEKAGLIGCFCIFMLLLLFGPFTRSRLQVSCKGVFFVSGMSLVLLEYLVTVSQAFSSLISLFPINFYPRFFLSFLRSEFRFLGLFLFIPCIVFFPYCDLQLSILGL
jgi:hypothetical protein